ncbi:hypothetical protein PVL29_004348 [Vitis rotundifolia]|uniref:Uncharacterized protein n=1 Tax=Vitis rotundifolia TaxID=103349 RepID=A0AA39AA21_VITRO|nr:hypothetical protein PVL29_004348 [Vitis rotundifolia]
MSIVAEIPGYLELLSDGSIKRLQQQTSPVSNDSPSNGRKCKDVIINSTKPISARIFLPDILGSFQFWFNHMAWVPYFPWRPCGGIRLPIAYDDCYGSLEWPSCQVSSEPWLERADLSRVFLILKEKPCDKVETKGLLIIHPFFGREERTEKERASGGEAEDLACTDLYWKLSLPEGWQNCPGLNGVATHLYHMLHPESEATHLLQKQMSEFIHTS